MDEVVQVLQFRRVARKRQQLCAKFPLKADFLPARDLVFSWDRGLNLESPLFFQARRCFDRKGRADLFGWNKHDNVRI